MTRDTSLDGVRRESWDRAAQAYGTGYVFESRARKLGRRIRGLTGLGILVPLAVAGVVLAFGVGSRTIPYVLTIASLLGIVQLIGSGWALVARWQESLTYSQESASDNYRLSEQYRKLANDPPGDARARFEILEAAYQARCDSDYKQEVREREKLKWLRAALLRFGRECAACKVVPASMQSTSCGVCGNF